MKDLGLSKYFLGVEVARGPDGFGLCQRKYAIDIISEAGLLGGGPQQSHLSRITGSPCLRAKSSATRNPIVD